MMKHHHLQFVLLICDLLLLGCNKKTATVKNFDDYEFKSSIEGDGCFNIGHSFKINKEQYIEDKYNFICLTKDLEERKLLILESLKNDNSPIYWREVNLPFKILKKAKGDTFILIKNNKKLFSIKLKFQIRWKMKLIKGLHFYSENLEKNYKNVSIIFYCVHLGMNEFVYY